MKGLAAGLARVWPEYRDKFTTLRPKGAKGQDYWENYDQSTETE